MSRFKDVKHAEMQDFINAPLKDKQPSKSRKEETSSINESIDTSISIDINVRINSKKLSLEGHNPKSIKRRVFNMRLNDYYLHALEQLANHDEGISMQQIAREILEKGLDALIKENKR